MHTYILLVKSQSRAINNTRFRVNAWNVKSATRKLKYRLNFEFPDVKKFSLSDPIRLDSQSMPKKNTASYGLPAQDHTGYYAVRRGKVIGAYLRYETARAYGSIVTTLRFAVELYGYERQKAA